MSEEEKNSQSKFRSTKQDNTWGESDDEALTGGLSIESLQAELESQLNDYDGFSGVGLSYNKQTLKPAFNVYLNEIDCSKELPLNIGGIEIQYEKIDKIQAFDEVSSFEEDLD